MKCLWTGLLFSLLLPAGQAYQLSTPFSTEHYAVNQVILDRQEKYDSDFRRMLLNDISIVPQDHSKLQITTAVFPFGSKGMSGNMREKVLGIIAVSNYGGGADKKPVVNLIRDAKYASQIGIYFTLEQLQTMADSRVIGKLLDEMSGFPLVISNLRTDYAGTDFRGDIHYATKSRAYVLDFTAIDSLFYTKKQMQDVKAGCTISLMAMPDRVLSSGEIPLYIAMHGVVNDIRCH